MWGSYGSLSGHVLLEDSVGELVQDIFRDSCLKAMCEGLYIVLIISSEPEGETGLTVSPKQCAFCQGAISKPIIYANSTCKLIFDVRCSFLLWKHV